MLLSLKVEALWVAQSKHQFNTMAYGKLFGSEDNTVVTAGEDGIVRLFSDPATLPLADLKLKRCLETKGGPSFHMIVRDVTRLSPCDMLVADTRGSVVLFCDGQILNRRGFFSAATSQIVALEVQETATGQVCIIVGRDNGEIICFNTFTQLWRLRLSDSLKQKERSCVSVTCILAARITISSFLGAESDYILVADSQRNIYVIQDARVLRVISTPAVVTSMVVGRFLEMDVTGQMDSSKQPTQIALGCDDGSIRICADFHLDQTPYADIGKPVTQVRRVPACGNYATSSKSDQAVDLLLCVGHFSSLLILQHGKVIHTYQLSSWPVTTCGLADSLLKNVTTKDKERLERQILVGCRDSSMHLLSIT